LPKRSPSNSPVPDPIFDVVHARILRGFPGLVAELGGEPRRLIEDAGLGSDGRSAGASGFGYRQLVALLEHSARVLQCPDFGLRLAMQQRGGRMFGPLGKVMRNAPTFGDAIHYVSTHTSAHSLAARVWLHPTDPAGALFVGHDILLDRLPERSQAIEQILLIGHLNALEISDGRARARRVHFRHQPVSRPIAYRRYFGCEVRFGEQVDGLVFHAGDLAAPIVRRDARTFRAVTAFIEARFAGQEAPVSAQARGVIMQLLGSPGCDNDTVASALNLHPRSLHRRLSAEGTSFQRLMDAVRRDTLLYYLERTDVPVARISERLGFSEQAVMSRRCRHWFDCSPSELRERARRDRR